MKIRTPELKDSESISKVLHECFEKINSKEHSKEEIEAWKTYDTPNNIREKIQDKALRNFIATENNQIIGFLSIATNEELLNSLYVKPSANGKGIGTELLEIAELLLKNRGSKKISVVSSKSAEKFYKKRGYQELKEIDVTIENTKFSLKKMTKDL